MSDTDGLETLLRRIANGPGVLEELEEPRPQHDELLKQAEALAQQDNERHANEDPARPLTPEEKKAREVEVEQLIKDVLAQKSDCVYFDPMHGWVMPPAVLQRAKLRDIKLNVLPSRYAGGRNYAGL